MLLNSELTINVILDSIDFFGFGRSDTERFRGQAYVIQTCHVFLVNDESTRAICWESGRFRAG